ncbi:MAG TPA: mechanosensitive ion channel domain-containing protein [Bryobacteraceae bacterium]|nr:mechanosensitive ion channel domain-containing protein [Bryobacteraceae bacterium]
MKESRGRFRVMLGLLLLVLVALGVLAKLHIPLFGGAGYRLEHYLSAPLFTLGGLPITLYFLLKVTIFIVGVMLVSHFTMLLLQKKVLIHTPLALGQQYAVSRVTSYLIFLLGLIIGLQSLGVNLNSLVVVGGALGIGVGLGLQAVVSNFVAGLILLVEQPVKLGDRIAVGETYGDVVRLRGRSTWIRTNENVIIIVPNSEFINQRVTNWTANDRQVRISLQLGVSYDSDPKSVRDLLLQVAAQHTDVLSDPAPEVIFRDFGDSSLDFELRVWTVQQVQTPARLKSDLYFAVFEAFQNAEIELPFPQRDLHVRSVSEPLQSALASLKNS